MPRSLVVGIQLEDCPLTVGASPLRGAVKHAALEEQASLWIGSIRPIEYVEIVKDTFLPSSRSSFQYENRA